MKTFPLSALNALALVSGPFVAVPTMPSSPAPFSPTASSRAPLVTVLSVNYNQAEVTRALLSSLRAVTYPRTEVVVVDNGSPKPGQAAAIAAGFPEVRVIAHPTNDGFAGGNNVGIRVAQGDYVLLLNNDTEVEPGFLEPLVAAMEADPSLGLASPKIRYHHTPDTIQYAGCGPIDPLTMRGHVTGHNEVDCGQHDTSGITDLGHGAALLIRRSVLEEVGLLPALYFLYYEEHDFAAHVTRAGWRVAYVAESVVYHKESMTVGKENALKTYYMTRNRLLYLRRNVHGTTFWLALAFVIGVALPKHTLVYLLRRRFDLLSALWRGTFWHLGRLGHRPAMHGLPQLERSKSDAASKALVAA